MKLLLSDSEYSGVSGCNAYGGPWWATESGIAFGGAGRNEIGCRPRLAEPEERFHAARAVSGGFILMTRPRAASRLADKVADAIPGPR